MTDQEIKIREMEERIKKLEDVVFNQWLSQYGYGNSNLPTNYVANVDLGTHTVVDFEHNYTQEPNYYGPFDGQYGTHRVLAVGHRRQATLARFLSSALM